jgi:hypothetical protein
VNRAQTRRLDHCRDAVLGQVRGVGLPPTVGHQPLQAGADHLRSRVAEHPLGGPIEGRDRRLIVDDDDGLAGCVDDRALPRLALLKLGLLSARRRPEPPAHEGDEDQSGQHGKVHRQVARGRQVPGRFDQRGHDHRPQGNRHKGRPEDACASGHANNLRQKILRGG